MESREQIWLKQCNKYEVLLLLHLHNVTSTPAALTERNKYEVLPLLHLISLNNTALGLWRLPHRHKDLTSIPRA